MSSFNIINLGDGQPVDLGEHLDGGWGPARLIELDAGTAHSFDATGAEICAFVISTTNVPIRSMNAPSSSGYSAIHMKAFSDPMIRHNAS